MIDYAGSLRRETSRETSVDTRVDTPVDVAAVLKARQRIAPWVRRTPLVTSGWLSEVAGADVRLKLESLQLTHSFKARGAFNAALMLREPAREVVPRLVAASSGNHGRALAHAAQMLGMPCVVFVPADTPAAKLNAIRASGAELRAEAPDYDAAEARAKAFAVEEGATYVSPYNDPRIVAGTGTIALELLEDQPDVEQLLVPLGGGGLIGGIATVIKSLKPGVRVIGVEAEHNPVFHTRRALGPDAPIPIRPTLADGLGGNVEAGSMTIELIERLVDDIVLVSEEAIGAAIADFVTHEQLLIEGAAAVAAAALLTRRVAGGGRPTVVVVSGANIDRSRLARLLSADTRS